MDKNKNISIFMNSRLIVTLDIGNESTVCAIPSKYGVDVVQDETSKRHVPSVITLNDKRLLFGDIALQGQSQNLDCTITHIKSLIGLKYNSETREKMQKSFPFFLSKMEDDFTGIGINLNGKWETVHPIVFLAFIIFDSQKRIEYFKPGTKPENREFYFISEPWWGQVERKLVQQCAKVAGIKLTKFFNSTTSSAINFSFEHAKLIPRDEKNPIYTAFIDFGESSISISTFKMWKDNIVAIDHSYDRNIGGQDFTDCLVEFLVKKTMQKYKVDPRENRKQFIRFMRECEKVKRALSVNQTMLFDCQGICGIDISFPVQRTEFETCCAPLIEKLDLLLKSAAEQSPKKCSFVEVIGGATRPPCVKQLIQNAFKCEIRQSMNAEECVACGAAHTAHINTHVVDIIGSPIFISYTMPSGKNAFETLFRANTPYNTTNKKTIAMGTNIISIINEKGTITTIAIEGMSEKFEITATIDENGIANIDDIRDLTINRKATYTITEHYGPNTEEEINEMKAFCDQAIKRENRSKEAEAARGNLELELMKRPQSDAQNWFEEHEYELMEKEEYMFWINVLKGGKANIAQIRTYQSRVSKVLDACCNAGRGDSAQIAEEAVELISYLSENERTGVISTTETEARIKKLELKAQKYML